jgi:general secretion pathway protein M
MIVIREWYASRSARERRLILVMLAIALPLLAWLLVVVPLGSASEAALERHLEAVDRNGRVRALADPVRVSRPAPVVQIVGAADLALVVTEAAAQSGLTLDSTTPAGPDAVSINISQARPVAAVQWLRDFELRGIRVEDLRMAPGADGTVSLSARLVRTRP